MPPLLLATLLHDALPGLSTRGRAVINTLVCDNGCLPSVGDLCTRLGLRSRFQLRRLLRYEGLPPYEELSGWVSVFHWVLRAEADGETLHALARHEQRNVETCYRLVRRVTGLRWSALRRLDRSGLVEMFRARYAGPSAKRSVWSSQRPMLVPPARANPSALAAGHSPRRLSVGGGPFDIALHPAGWAYVSRLKAAALERLDFGVAAFVGSVPIGCTPGYIALDAARDLAYVSVHFDDEIAVIDTARHVRVGTFAVAGDPLPLRLSPSGLTLFVTTNEDRLHAISVRTGRSVGSLPLPATSHHLALHPLGHLLYVATRAAGTVLEVDTTQMRVQRTFDLGGWPQGLVLSADCTTLYVANEKDGLNVVQLANGRCIGPIPLAGGGCEIALGRENRSLYVGLVHDGKVQVVDSRTLAAGPIYETGGKPRSIRVSRDGRLLIVVNEAGWVDILPTASRTLPLPLATPGAAADRVRTPHQL
jgi:DNA-binding beta-propeller fold protein YncE